MPICEPKLPHCEPSTDMEHPLWKLLDLVGTEQIVFYNKFKQLRHRLLHVGFRKHILDLSREMRTVAA